MKLLIGVADRRPRRDHLLVHALSRHRRGASASGAARPALRVESDRRNRHRARSASFRLSARLRRDRDLSVSRLSDAARPGERGILKTKHGEATQIGRSYRRGIKKGLLKIISKMGIATIGSYGGAQFLEIVGLDREVVDLCFTGTPSRIGGATFASLQEETVRIAGRAWDNNVLVDRRPAAVHAERRVPPVQPRRGRHPAARSAQRPTQRIRTLRRRGGFSRRPQRCAVCSRSTPRKRMRYRSTKWSRSKASSQRFDTAAMSLGALSPEAHEALAIAMNRLGGRSNSGEGGEDPLRYGTDKVSKIKQVASGRFGVTPRVSGQRRSAAESRSRRAPSPAKAASCRGTRSTH